MTEREELSYALSVLRKHNMPVCPILEYAMKVRLDKFANSADCEDAVSVAAEPVAQYKTIVFPKEGTIRGTV